MQHPLCCGVADYDMVEELKRAREKSYEYRGVIHISNNIQKVGQIKDDMV